VACWGADNDGQADQAVARATLQADDDLLEELIHSQFLSGVL